MKIPIMSKKDQLLTFAKQVFDKPPYIGRTYSIPDGAGIVVSEILLEAAMTRVSLNFDTAEHKLKIEMINELEIAIKRCIQTKCLDD